MVVTTVQHSSRLQLSSVAVSLTSTGNPQLLYPPFPETVGHGTASNTPGGGREKRNPMRKRGGSCDVPLLSSAVDIVSWGVRRTIQTVLELQYTHICGA